MSFVLPRRAAQGVWNQSQREARAGGIKAGRVGPSKPLISHMRLQNLEFSLLGFRSWFVPYFLTMLPFVPFGMIVHILCHHILDVCNLIFFFNLIGD